MSTQNNNLDNSLPSYSCNSRLNLNSNPIGSNSVSLNQSQITSAIRPNGNNSRILPSSQNSNAANNSSIQQDNSLVAELNGLQNGSSSIQRQSRLRILQQLINQAIVLQQENERKVKIDQVIQKVQRKAKPLKQYAQVFRGKVYLSMAKLMQVLPEMINDISNLQTMNGLTQTQQSIWKSYKQGKINEIQNSDIEKVLNQQEVRIQTRQYLAAQQNIQATLNHFNQQISVLQSSIRKNIHLIQFKSSTILKSNQDIQKLTKFFDKKIRKAELLYRGSRDSFKASKFHELCDNIEDTLTIVQTSQNKIIGGYTPLAWTSPQEYYWARDDQLKSFIFQLNQNDKFTLVPEQAMHATCRRSDYGPGFGGALQLHICNDANINQSHGNIGDCYSNSSYMRGDTNSLNKFSGGKHFTVKDYEVWQLKFV